MNKIFPIIIKLLIILILIQFVNVPTSYASFWGDIFSAGDQFIEDAKASGDTIAADDVKSVVDQIYNVLFSLGVVLTVLVGAILGIKFMIGSVEEQAKIKEMLIPYVISCIVIYGAFGIWKLMVTLLSSI